MSVLTEVFLKSQFCKHIDLALQFLKFLLYFLVVACTACGILVDLPAVEARSPNHWEVPKKILKDRKVRMSLLNGPPWWLSGKESACNSGDLASIPGLGRSPGVGHGNPFQYSCLENSMDGGAWLQSMGLQRVRHD